MHNRIVFLTNGNGIDIPMQKKKRRKENLKVNEQASK